MGVAAAAAEMKANDNDLTNPLTFLGFGLTAFKSCQFSDLFFYLFKIPRITYVWEVGEKASPENWQGVRSPLKFSFQELG